MAESWNIGTLTTTLQPIVKAGTSESIVIREIWVENHGGSASSFNMMLLKADEAQDNGFYLIKDKQVRADQGGLQYDQKYLCLSPGDTLLVSANDNSLLSCWMFGDRTGMLSYTDEPTFADSREAAATKSRGGKGGTIPPPR